MNEPARHPDIQPSTSDIRMVIAASSAGTVFEWYDFFIYATLESTLKQAFFPTGSATLSLLLFWLVFAVGFGFRPLGAILFGFLGDKLGRKYTFLVTVTLMGIATAGVGFIPSAETIGLGAPALVILLRIMQGLALGGEYGGAAIYVSEHAPPERRGFFTGFIQSSVVGGFVLSLIVVLTCKGLMSAETWSAWGWRVPFILSIALLGVSLWMRLKLSESPVFRAMQEEGEIAGNPFVESFTYPGNKRRIFVALFGIAAGLTVIWYTATFSARTFLLSAMRVEETTANVIVGIAAALGMAFYVIFGQISDRIGRKKPIMFGYALTLLLLFPTFWFIGSHANPGLAEAAARAPIIVSGADCRYNPFSPAQATHCATLQGDLAAMGTSYKLIKTDGFAMTVAGKPMPLDSYPWDSKDAKARSGKLQEWLSAEGYNFATVKPSTANALAIIGALLLLMALSGASYGPVAALLSEMFPAKIRYSSMSIPYHIGTGYFGGFLPFIASWVIARTGDPYAGLWYTWIIVAVAFAVGLWGLQGGPPRDFNDDAN